MSARHPIISVTGSSGAGTTSVQAAPSSRSSAARTSTAAFIEGDAFHRYDRAEMKRGDGARRDATATATSATSAREANLLDELEEVFARLRRDRHAAGRATTSTTTREARAATARRPAPSPPWEDFAPGTDLLFYEGLHGAVVDRRRRTSRGTPTSRSASCR